MNQVQRRHGPDALEGTEAGNNKRLCGRIDYSALTGGRPEGQTDPVERLLDRLDGVQRTYAGWRARCPACGGTSRNVGIAVADNGSALVKCFKCHDMPGILAALGLSIADLFPLRDHKNIPPVERERLRAGWVEAKRQRDAHREQAQRAAQATARCLWHASAPALEVHPYLLDKLVKPHGIRQRNDLLRVPMRDAAGELWAVQTIAPDGTKRFLRDARKRGLYHAMGGVVADVLAICEGYATGASVHEATGYLVAVAFDAGNLEPVAVALRAKYPDVRMIICADDDKGTEERTGRNPGRHYAEQAARAVGGTVALPEFAP